MQSSKTNYFIIYQCFEDPNLLKKTFSLSNIKRFQTPFLDKIISKNKKELEKRTICLKKRKTTLISYFNDNTFQNNISYLIPNRDYYHLSNNNKIMKKIKTLKKTNYSIYKNCSVNKIIDLNKSICSFDKDDYLKKNSSCNRSVITSGTFEKIINKINLKKEKKIDFRKIQKQKFKNSLETTLYIQR